MIKRPALIPVLSAFMLSGCVLAISDGDYDSNKRRYQNADEYKGESYRNNHDGGLSKTDEGWATGKPLADFLDMTLIETGRWSIDDKPDSPRIVNLDDMVNTLADYDVIFVGENHGHAANHALQMKIFSGLYAKNTNLTLSMEQFERDVQGVVDQYLAGEIGESVLKKDGRAWPHYAQSYRPLVEFAKSNKLSVIAAEAPTSIVRCVGLEGPAFLDRLKGEPRTWAARELNMFDGAYKDKFMSFLSGSSHGAPPKSKEASAKAETKNMRSFAGQVIRDDTMAESIADHIKANPRTQVMHIDGHFHSAGYLGTVERLKLRMPELKIAVVQPITVEDTKNPSFTKADLNEGAYLALIHPTPKMFVKRENMMAFMRETGKKMTNRKCEY
jgi:uncharacterized iron-regulated protein